jgi:hypothetical protein
MNKFTFFLCFILLISVKSEAQQRANKAQEPPKKSSKIIVMVKDTASTLFDKLTKTLFDYGYTIDNKDEKLKLLSTKERSSKKYSTLTRIRASINDTALILTSDIALGFSVDFLGARDLQPSYSAVYYGGAKKSPLREAWNELDAIAHKFGDNIAYSK